MLCVIVVSHVSRKWTCTVLKIEPILIGYVLCTAGSLLNFEAFLTSIVKEFFVGIDHSFDINPGIEC